MVELPPLRRRPRILNLEQAQIIVACLCGMRFRVPVSLQVSGARSVDDLDGLDIRHGDFIGRYAHEVAIFLVQPMDIIRAVSRADGILQW